MSKFRRRWNIAGDLMGDLNGRRGRISGMDTQGATQIIRAQVPMAEMLNYQNDLTSMTQGRASFSHGVRPLRLRAAAAGGQDHCRRQGCADGRRRSWKKNRISCLDSVDTQASQCVVRCVTYRLRSVG